MDLFSRSWRAIGRNTVRKRIVPGGIPACLILLLAGSLFPAGVCAQGPTVGPAPARVIFDTDIGNDVDDVLALSMIHSLMSRRECELLAVTVTKPDELAGPFVDLMNTFYGRPDIPIAVIREGFKNETGKFLPLAEVKDGGRWRFARDLPSSSATPEPVPLLRRILSRQEDNAVTLVQVGFFSNLAALLDSAPDEFSPLGGADLIRKKVKLLSVMAGAFQTIEHNNHYLEYNVIKDVPAAQKLVRLWPTPIVWSGFEIGITVPFPAISIERDFRYVAHHPAAEAYYLYQPPPHERPTWDLTAVLYGLQPDRDYFALSPPGRVTVEADGFTRFTPGREGRDRFLILDRERAARVREALVQLSSQPPGN